MFYNQETLYTEEIHKHFLDEKWCKLPLKGMEQHWTRCAAVSKATAKLWDDSVIRHLENPATQQQHIHMLIK